MERNLALENYNAVVNIMDSFTDRVNGYDFYKYIFPKNEEQGEQQSDFSRPNAIFMHENRVTAAKREYSKRIMLSDTWEDDYTEYVELKEKTLCSGMAYRGRSTLQKNEQQMNALIFDLDGVGSHEIKNILHRMTLSPSMLRSLPYPTFLVVSGGGVHLYYVFDEPIAMFPNIRKQLKEMKYDLTYKMWDYKCTSQFQKVQYQRIGQPFRMVGSINEKHGNEIIAYKMGDRVSIDYMNRYVMKAEHRVDIKKRYKSSMTLAEAQELYPEWAESVINGTHKRGKWDIAGKTHGKDPWALYHWWLRQIEHIEGGHRYFYMMCCVIYGSKCDVPRDVIEEDLWKVYEHLKMVDHENPLEKEDVWSALKIYKKDMYNYTIDDIKKLTLVPIEKNKRNYRKQSEHLTRARAVQEVDYPNGSWRNKDGRPTKARIVEEWQKTHPGGRKVDCIRETGLSKPTVIKWWQNHIIVTPKYDFDYILKTDDGKEILIEREVAETELAQEKRLKKYLELLNKKGV